MNQASRARRVVLFVPAVLLALGAAVWWTLPANKKPASPGLLVQDLGGESLRRWDPTKPSVIPAPELVVRREAVPAGSHSKANDLGPNSFALQRTKVLRKKGDSYAYNSESYGVTFADGGIDFGLPVRNDRVGQPVIGYSLDEIRSGDAVLVRGGSLKPQARPDRSEVYFDRGSVEEVYSIRPEGLEQSFLVRSLSQSREDLTVVGSLRTNLVPPQTRTPEPSLTFSDGVQDQLVISHAVAKDGAGRELALALSYSDGKLSMTVPKEWLREAELPILIDPLIGSAITFRDPGLIQSRVFRGVEVAYSAPQNSYLVVWHEQIGATFDQTDVLGQRVAADGSLLGGPISIGDAPSTDANAAVSYAPAVDRFLVSWYQNAGSIRLAGRILNGDGTFHTSTFEIAAGPGVNSSIAFDGTNWFVLFAESAGSLGYYQRGRFVGTTGLVGTAVDLDTDLDVSAYSALAFTNGTYLLVYAKGTQSRALYGRTMDAAGSFLSAPTLLWVGEHVMEDQSVSAGGGRFLVLWTHSGVTTLQGQIWDPSLSTVAGPFTLETQAWPISPRAAYSETNAEWVMSYITGFPWENTEVYVRRISSTGALTARERLTTDTIPQWSPNIAWNSTDNEALVAFYQGEAGGLLAVVGQLLDLGPSSPAPAPPTALAATAGNNSVLLSWNASAGATSYTVKRGSVPGGPYPVTFSGIPGTAYTDTTAINGTTYFYVVTALNASGESGPSNEAAAMPVPPVPGAPGGLVATPQNGAVNLSWNGVSGAASYTVRRSTTSGGPYTEVATGLTSPAYLDPNLTNDTTYYYVVAASNLGGTGPNSNQAQATPRAPSAQVLFVTSAGTPGAGDAVIEARLRALGYTTVIREGSASKTTDALGKAAVVISSTLGSGSVNTKFRDVAVPVVNWENALHDDLGMTGLVSGTDYGTTGAQTALSIVDAAHPLAAGLTGTVTVSTSSIYSWGVPNANAAKVATLSGNPGRSVIFAYEAGAAMPGLVAPARRVGFFLEDLTPAAWNAQGQALFDAAIGWATGGSGAGAPPPPSGLTATSGDGEIDLSWTGTSGTPTYTVKRGTSPGGPYVPVATGIAQTSYTDPGLTNGVAYFYVVTAEAGTFSSGPSNEAFATPTGFPIHALLVVGSTTLGSGDAAVKARLEGLGFTVTVKDGPSSTSADAAGKSLVVISSTISSGSVNTKFRVSAVPVLTWENALFDDFGMTGLVAGTAYGTLAAQTRVAISGAGHPLAAGLSGSVVVSASGPFTWGVPNGSAILIGSLDGDPTRSTIFAYEAGAGMPGLVAPARRVGFFLEDVTAGSLTPSGWALFDAAVRWAASVTPGAPAAPTGLVATSSPTEVLLNWNASTGASTYSVKRSLVTGGPYTPVQTGITGTSFADTTVAPDTTYYYVVTALAGSAESGPSNEAAGTPISAAREALLVVGNTSLGGGDAAVKSRLEGLGFAVTVKDGPSSATADATGKALVVISSTIGSATVNTKFRTVGVPVINWENALYDDFGMTALVQGTDFGTTAGQTTVLTIDSAHPLAAGLNGIVAVTTQAQIMSWGVPGPNAARAASLAGDATRSVVFGYEAGAAMPGLVAPARRVGFFLEDVTAASLGVNGWKLFDAAVQWAIQAPGQPLPNKPVITTASQTTNDPTPDVVGTSDPDVSISVFITQGATLVQTLNTNADPLGQWGVTAALLADGVYTVRARASNGAGDSPDSEPITIAVDTGIPGIANLASSSPDDTYTLGAPINITVVFTEPVILSGGALQVTLDTGAVVSIAPFGPANSAGGVYFVGANENSPDLTALSLVLEPGAMLVDPAGNAALLGIPVGGNLGELRSIVVNTTTGTDVIPPAITGVFPANGAFVNLRRPRFLASITDSGGSGIASVQMMVDGALVAATVTNFDLERAEIAFTPSADLSEGSHALEIRARDGAQHLTTVSSLFTIDATPPTVTLIVTPGDPLVAQKTITATFQDSLSGLVAGSRTVLVDLIPRTQDGQFNQNSWTLVETFAEAVHSVVAQARDAAGNLGQATLTFTVGNPQTEPDGNPPQVTLNFPQGSLTEAVGSTVPILVMAKDNEQASDTGISIVELLVNGEVRQTLTAASAQNGIYYSFPLTLLESDKPTLLVRARATDNGGVTAETFSATVNVVDPPASGPVRLQVTLPAGPQTSGVSFNLTVTPVDAQGAAVPYSGFAFITCNLASSSFFGFFDGETQKTFPFTITGSGVGILQVSNFSSPPSGTAAVTVNPTAATQIAVEIFRRERISPGQTLSEVRAQVKDASGNPVPNASVNWSVVYAQDSTNLDPMTGTSTTDADGYAMAPPTAVPSNSSNVTLSASLTSAPGVTASASAKVMRVVFNIALVQRTVEAGMPVSFTITAINAETGEIATDYTGAVYVYRYQRFVIGETTFVGLPSTEAHEAPESVAVQFTVEDRGVKYVDNGIRLVEASEMFLVASTDPPSIESQFTITHSQFEEGQFVVYGTTEFIELEDPGLSTAGFSDEIVVVASRPAKILGQGLGAFPVRALVKVIDRFGNGVPYEHVKFEFDVNGNESTWEEATTVFGFADGIGPSNLAVDESHFIQATVTVPAYASGSGSVEPHVMVLGTTPTTSGLVLGQTSPDDKLIRLGVDDQSIADVSGTYTGHTLTPIVERHVQLLLRDEPSSGGIVFKAVTFDGHGLEPQTPTLTAQSMSFVLKNVTPISILIDSNGFPVPTPFTFTFTLSMMTVDVPSAGDIPARHPDARLDVFSGSETRTVGFFDKMLIFTGPAVIPEGNPALQDPVSEKDRAGVFLMDPELATRSMTLNAAMLYQATGAGFRVQVLDRDFGFTDEMRIRLESLRADGSPVLDPGTQQPVVAVLPLLYAPSSASPTGQRGFITPQILPIRSQALFEEAVGGVRGQVTLYAQTSVPADGTTRAAIDVKVTYADGTPAPNASVLLELVEPLPSTPPVLEPAPATNAAGRTRGYVSSTLPGTVGVRAHVTVENPELHPEFPVTTPPVRILFVADYRTIQAEPAGSLRATLVRGEGATESPVSEFSDQVKEAVVLGVEVRVQPQQEGADRPAPYAVFKGLAPRIEFTFLPSIEAFELPDLSDDPLDQELFDLEPGPTVAIVVDDGYDDSSNDRMTEDPEQRVIIPVDDHWKSDFQAVGQTKLIWNVSPGRTPFRLGANRLRVAVMTKTPGTHAAISVARMLAYTDENPILAARFNPGSIAQGGDIQAFQGTELLTSGLEPGLTEAESQGIFQLVRNRVLLGFTEQSSDIQISQFLHSHRLAPVAAIRDPGFIVGMRTGQLEPGETLSLVQSLRTEINPSLLLTADPELLNPPDDHDTPSAAYRPARLMNDMQASQVTRNGGISAAEILNSHFHFQIRTYEGIRLTNTILADRAFVRAARLGHMDTGIYDGTGGATNNLTAAQLGQLWILNNSGVPTLATLAQIADTSAPTGGHGTLTAVAAVGDGISAPLADGVVGTYPGGVLSVHRWTRPGSTGATASDMIAMLERMVNDATIRVVNMSFRMDTGTEAAVQRVIRSGKIVVKSAGNTAEEFTDGWDTGVCRMAPSGPRGAAEEGVRLLVVVSGMSRITNPGVRADAWRDATGGTNWSEEGRVSVAAPAEDITSTSPTGALTTATGTSLAAPLVAGTLLGMVELDQAVSASLGEPVMTPLEIVELLEATADSVGPPSPIVGKTGEDHQVTYSDAFGHGRINVWKAYLAVANRGVAVNKGGGFSVINDQVIADPETNWYGFDIRSRNTSDQNATVWINTGAGSTRLADGFDANGDGFADGAFNGEYPLLRSAPTVAASPLLGAGTIGLFMGVQNTQFDPIPFGNLMPAGTGQFMGSFSMRRSRLVNAPPAGLRRLELRRPGDGAAVTPFYSVDLDLASMRSATQTNDNVLFDDFVFTIGVPAAITRVQREMIDGNIQPTTEVLNDPAVFQLASVDNFSTIGRENAAEVFLTFTRFLAEVGAGSIGNASVTFTPSGNLTVTSLSGGAPDTTTDALGRISCKVIKTAPTGAAPNTGVLEVAIDANGPAALGEVFRVRVIFPN